MIRSSRARVDDAALLSPTANANHGATGGRLFAELSALN
jgi:hypothetical protein